MRKFCGIGSVKPRITYVVYLTTMPPFLVKRFPYLALHTCIPQSISPHLVRKKSSALATTPPPTAKCSSSIFIRFRGHSLIQKRKRNTTACYSFSFHGLQFQFF